MDYLSNIPAPLLDDLIQGRCVPFVGAGFSRNAVTRAGEKMPLWDDLGRALAQELPDYGYAGALDAVSAYEHEYSRAKLVEKLQGLLLTDTARPGMAHGAFCSLPFELVVTTNFDFLLEQGYARLQRHCQPVINEDQLSVHFDKPSVALLKLHGDLHHPNRLVATEEDYDAFLNRYPLLATYLANLLIRMTPLFLGYSLDDPDFRQVWQVIGDRLGRLRRQAYTIAVGADRHTVSRFDRRGVKVINLPGRPEEIAEALGELFVQLHEYWFARLLKSSTATEEEPLAELVGPKNATSRLCYMSASGALLPWFKRVVYPMVVEHGFTPVASPDIISPGDNTLAKVLALLERAELVVIDVSNAGTQQELAWATSLPHKRVLAIVPEGSGRWLDGPAVTLVTRQVDVIAYDEGVVASIDAWFAKAERELRAGFEDEPMRLLEKQEYRAAVVSAITLLERSLAEFLLPQGENRLFPRPSLHQMLDWPESREILAETEHKRILTWMRTRNQIVHADSDVTKRKAQAVVKGVQTIMAKLRGGESN